MYNFNFKSISLCLALALAASLGMTYKYYQEAQLFKSEQAEFEEYRKTKTEQQEKLQKLLQEHEKMLRDISEVTNLEKKLRRSIYNKDTNKLSSSLGANTTSETIPNSGYTAQGGSKGAMTGLAALQALEAQNKNINIMLTDTKRSVSELLGEIDGRSGSLASFPNKWPTEGGVISSSYGGRTDPIASGSEWHQGIDIAVDFGAPVYAAGAGTVEFSDWNGGYGRYIRINHDNGYKTSYGHMSALIATNGQRVAKGEIIGLIGSTGYSTGPHLHFEVEAEGQTIDPHFVLKR